MARDAAPTSAEAALLKRLQDSAENTRKLFQSELGAPSGLKNLDLSSQYPPEVLPTIILSPEEAATRANVASRTRKEYEDVMELPPALAAKQASAQQSAVARRRKARTGEGEREF